ncbi:MAG: DinB family protein, partial [Saprospiraceae bacterium]|nr:DinB family protein [Saprospiraceae bacterium]
PEVNGAGLFNQLKSMALRLALWSPIRFAAARGVGNDVLPARGSFEQVSEDWLAQRAILRTYMEGLDAKRMDKVVYKHPYVGKLSLGQMLDFFNAHFHRHQHQILERLPQS